MSIQTELLLTPGPTTIPAQIFVAMSQSMHHRTEVFKAVLNDTRSKLKSFLDSELAPILLACSGTGAMEASLLNTCKTGDKIIVLNAGKFGERWIEIAECLNLSIVQVTAEWGGTVTIDQIKQVLKQHSDATAFCLQYCETSTTTLHAVPEISQCIKTTCPNMLVIVDAITAIAVLPIALKTLPIDILVGSSQKALMLPPGLSFLALSHLAWDKTKKNKIRSHYFNLLEEQKSQDDGGTAWTPAINLILGLNMALNMLASEGPQKVFERHAMLAKLTRAGMQALGFNLLASACPAPGVTGAFTPQGIDAEQLRKIILKDHAVRCAGGQGKFKGKIIRVGHMGYVSTADILRGLTAIGLSLSKLDAKIDPALGVNAALSILKE